MRGFFAIAVIIAVFELGESYSKYGRTCQDIGCVSNEVCVMKEDACTMYSRNNCGKYPTCTRVSNALRTCSNYICPPTQACRMDRGQPKCFTSAAGSGSRDNHRPRTGYPSAPNSRPAAPAAPTYPNPNYPTYNRYQPQNPYGNSYGSAQTTSRPNVYRPGQNAYGGGYSGGVMGSGYPGQSVPGRYPTRGGGNPGYAGQGYPQYTGQGYPSQGRQSGYGYSGQGGGYYNPGYQNSGGQRYTQQSSEEDGSNSVLDTLSWLGKKFLQRR